jgi:hypothetical protein
MTFYEAERVVKTYTERAQNRLKKEEKTWKWAALALEIATHLSDAVSEFRAYETPDDRVEEEVICARIEGDDLAKRLRDSAFCVIDDLTAPPLPHPMLPLSTFTPPFVAIYTTEQGIELVIEGSPDETASTVYDRAYQKKFSESQLTQSEFEKMMHGRIDITTKSMWEAGLVDNERWHSLYQQPGSQEFFTELRTEAEQSEREGTTMDSPDEDWA